MLPLESKPVIIVIRGYTAFTMCELVVPGTDHLTFQKSAMPHHVSSTLIIV